MMLVSALLRSWKIFIGKVSEINWQNKDNFIATNKAFPCDGFVEAIDINFQGHIVLATSGTTSEKKWLALSKTAILTSAKSVNKFLNVTAKDSWLLTLPSYHIGGLSIYARAFLSGCRVIEFDSNWSSQKFTEKVESKQVTISSLVPTQVHDLVAKEMQAPSCIRCVLVGGGNLNGQLYLKARKLGWPLLPTYGLSECSSQVATSPLETLKSLEIPPYQLLDHVEVSINKSGQVCLQSPSLFSAYVFVENGQIKVIVRNEPLFVTEDIGRLYKDADLPSQYIKILGRKGDFKKVKGLLVNESQLNQRFQEFSQKVQGIGELILKPDLRQENKIVLVSESKLFTEVNETVKLFNQNVGRAERIEAVYFINKLPRTGLGKIKKTLLLKKLVCS